MNKQIDARGLECPKPVLLTKAAIDAGEREIFVTVDNRAAVENVTRLAQSCRFGVTSQQDGKDFVLHLQSDAAGEQEKTSLVTDVKIPCVTTDWSVFVSRKIIGSGDETLGSNLMRMYFYTLNETTDLPASILLMNEGVFCAVEDEQLISHLKELERKGVVIMVCGTCLNFYKIADKLAVGKVSNMYDILSAMQAAGKVVTL